MKVFREFKEFAVRGNVMDLAVGIIIGGAFGKVVSSMVNDILMPPIGVLIGGLDFSSFGIILRDAQAPVLLKYGVFINNLIDFVIVAAAVFVLIKVVNRMKKAEPAAAAPAATKICPECLMPIPAEAKRCGHCTVLLL